MNPFELDSVADSYDLHKSAIDTQQAWVQEGRFLYPSMFGSSGGSAFLLLLRYIDRFAPELKSLLEVGCGVGAFFETLRANKFSFDYTGVDFSVREIERARANYPGTRFDVADAAALPFPDASFDMVFENNLFPFLLKPAQVIRELVRVSRRYVLFQCQASTLSSGLYCSQPLYSTVTIERDEAGREQCLLPESLAHELRPPRVLPQLMRQTASGVWQAVVAKVRKYYLPEAELDSLLDELGVEVLERHATPVGNYPAVVTPELLQNNTLDFISTFVKDGRACEEDSLISTPARDVRVLLKVKSAV